MRKPFSSGLLVAPALLLCCLGYANTVDVSSSTFGYTAPVTTQYASQDVTFATETSGGTLGTPVTGAYGWNGTDPLDGYVSGLANTPSGNYPTTEFLDIFFPNPASNISFWFDNFGCSSYGRGDSFYNAYGPGGFLGSVGLCPGTSYNFNQVVVPYSGVSEIQISNNTPDTFTYGYGSSWEFGLSRVDFTATPEPASLMLLGTAAAALGMYARRRRATAKQ